MKFMMNGAITIATLDGANIEISDEVGNNNKLGRDNATDLVNAISILKGYIGTINDLNESNSIVIGFKVPNIQNIAIALGLIILIIVIIIIYIKRRKK